MNIKLTAVNSKYIHSNLAVYSLKAMAASKGFDVDILEFTINQQEDTILRAIYETKPDVIAFSVYIWNVKMIEEIIDDLADVLSNAEIWLGGPEVTYRSREIMEKHPNITGVMRGEGEKIFVNLCRYWNSDKTEAALKDIPGITYRTEEGIFSNPDESVMDMDEIPFAYEHVNLPEHRIFYYESSRGCPFGCTYCLSSVEKGVRFRSIDLVKRELKYFIDNKAPQVKFVDRTFNCDRARTIKLWEFIKENDNGITNFHFETGAEILNDSEIELLNSMRPGLIQLECGVQSLNKETLKAIHRSMDFERLSENVMKIKKGGNIHIHLDLIAGLPFEDLESFKRSFNGVYELRPAQLQLGFLKVLSGSPMAFESDEYGCRYKKMPPYEVLKTKWLSYDDVILLKKVEEVFEVHYNSGQFTNTMEKLQQHFEDGFSMYEKLASFYDEKGYFEASHSRIRRYEILLEFIKENNLDPDEFKESILTDIYLRENLKNRPAWAPSLKEYDGRIRDFYKREAEEPEYLTSYKNYDWKQLRSMTHIEVFDKRAYLFDYRERNPLDHSAKMMVIWEEQ